MYERAYRFGGMKWLAGLIALPALLVMAIIFIAYVEDPRPVVPVGTTYREDMIRQDMIRESMGTASPDGPGLPRKYTSVASDTSYQSKPWIEKRIASMSIAEALPYLLGIVAAFGLLVSMVVLGVRRLLRTHA
ncbi:MAG: hypothetical protein F4Y49_02430 [Dehalococcoidia bacterium]|nr:hypothetical protein [Dehalococcoidia bacterium]